MAARKRTTGKAIATRKKAGGATKRAEMNWGRNDTDTYKAKKKAGGARKTTAKKALSTAKKSTRGKKKS